ncbi:MAG: arylamine N-acetyltransferase [Erythrobacter sp.]|nr:arylamine N-acetyltransferase [Erythrobacter sp.]
MAIATDLAAYLDRIGLERPVLPDPAGLLRVQAAHRQTIPFENLDVMLGRPIRLERDVLAAKLVQARRGGFCFEHNLLLGRMLAAMGFANRMLLARVLLGNPPEPTPRTHCLLLVNILGKPWIADAGFGGSYAPPMPLADGAEAESGDGARHRLRRIGKEGSLPGSWLLERRGPLATTDGRAATEAEWERQYAFELAEVAMADLTLGSHFASTHPGARHTQVTVVSRCLPHGFVSLVDRRFSRSQAGLSEQGEIADAAEYRALLAEEFGLDLSLQEVQALPLF